MNRRGLVAVVAALLIVSVAGVGGALALVGSGQAGLGSLFGETADAPALLHFESAGAECTDSFAANSSASVAVGGGTTEVTYARNVSLPDPADAIGEPTFARVNESTYVLGVPIEETEKAPRACPGVARYNATVRFPAGDEPWNLIVRHDGERVTTIHGDSNSTLLGGSASVSQGVSAPEPNGNTTTTAE